METPFIGDPADDTPAPIRQGALAQEPVLMQQNLGEHRHRLPSL
jgi:hypothetical protein